MKLNIIIFEIDKNNNMFYYSYNKTTGGCGYVQNSGLKTTDCLLAVSLTSGSQGSEPQSEDIYDKYFKYEYII